MIAFSAVVFGIGVRSKLASALAIHDRHRIAPVVELHDLNVTVVVCEGVVVVDVEELVLELSVLLLLDVEFVDVLFDVLFVVLLVVLFCELSLVDELVVVVFPELLLVVLPSFFEELCV